MKQSLRLRLMLPLVMAGGILLATTPSFAETVAPAGKARAMHIKVHSVNHAYDWARGLVFIYPPSAPRVQFYAASDPQMFDLLMTAVKIDANIIIKYETINNTTVVTSIELA